MLGGAAAAAFGYRLTLFMSFAVGLLGLIPALLIDRVEVRRTPLSWRRLGQALCSPSVLVPALLMAAAQMVAHATVFSFTSSIAGEAGASTVMLGVLSAVFTLVQILAAGSIASPRIARAPRNRTAAGGFLLLSGYLIILGGAGQVWMILLGQVLAAYGSALLNAILLAQCVKDAPAGERSTVVGIYQAVYGLGMTMGPVWMGWLLDHTGRAAGCGIFAAFTALTALTVLLFWREKEA